MEYSVSPASDQICMHVTIWRAAFQRRGLDRIGCEPVGFAMLSLSLSQGFGAPLICMAMSSNVAGRPATKHHTSRPRCSLTTALHRVFPHRRYMNLGNVPVDTPAQAIRSLNYLPNPGPTIARLFSHIPTPTPTPYLFSPAAYIGRSSRHGLQTKKNQQGSILVAR
jgi:hypothetical protein